MHEQDSFVRIRARKSQQNRVDDDERSLDDAFADYIERFGAFASADNGAAASADHPPEGDRWSTWDQSTPTERGPRPYPDWLVTELAAVDTELGVLKTGKEADVFLLDRGVPATDRRCLIAAKRYRDGQHRMFHRDSGYLEGRRDKESRVNRAMAKRTAFGKEAIAGQWANAEFAALCQLWDAGAAVSLPDSDRRHRDSDGVHRRLDGTAAPRLAQVRPNASQLADLWQQLERNLSLLARAGLAHGDLSAYNILVYEGRLILIDVPQIVDVIGNPRGRSFLERDVKNVGSWFVARGLPADEVGRLTADLIAGARLR